MTDKIPSKELLPSADDLVLAREELSTDISKVLRHVCQDSASFGRLVADAQIPPRSHAPYSEYVVDSWLAGDSVPNQAAFDAILVLANGELALHDKMAHEYRLASYHIRDEHREFSERVAHFFGEPKQTLAAHIAQELDVYVNQAHHTHDAQGNELKALGRDAIVQILDGNNPINPSFLQGIALRMQRPIAIENQEPKIIDEVDRDNILGIYEQFAQIRTRAGELEKKGRGDRLAGRGVGADFGQRDLDLSISLRPRNELSVQMRAGQFLNEMSMDEMARRLLDKGIYRGTDAHPKPLSHTSFAGYFSGDHQPPFETVKAMDEIFTEAGHPVYPPLVTIFDEMCKEPAESIWKNGLMRNDLGTLISAIQMRTGLYGKAFFEAFPPKDGGMRPYNQRAIESWTQGDFRGKGERETSIPRFKKRYSLREWFDQMATRFEAHESTPAGASAAALETPAPQWFDAKKSREFRRVYNAAITEQNDISAQTEVRLDEEGVLPRNFRRSRQASEGVMEEGTEPEGIKRDRTQAANHFYDQLAQFPPSVLPTKARERGNFRELYLKQPRNAPTAGRETP